jgi:hypothetical protein
MSILVVGKCSATVGRQIIGKALEFPGKRQQKSLPECCFTIDTDFDSLRQENKPRMAIFPIENIAHESCNVLSHCKNGISHLSRRFLTLFCKLIVLETTECLRTKKSISTWHWELYVSGVLRSILIIFRHSVSIFCHCHDIVNHLHLVASLV